MTDLNNKQDNVAIPQNLAVSIHAIDEAGPIVALFNDLYSVFSMG